MTQDISKEAVEPERIFAWKEVDEDGVHKFYINNPDKRTGEETEYVRADLHEALQARVAELEAHGDGVETFAVILRHIWKTQGIEAMNKRLTEASTPPKETP